MPDQIIGEHPIMFRLRALLEQQQVGNFHFEMQKFRLLEVIKTVNLQVSTLVSKVDKLVARGATQADLVLYFNRYFPSYNSFISELSAGRFNQENYDAAFRIVLLAIEDKLRDIDKNGKYGGVYNSDIKRLSLLINGWILMTPILDDVSIGSLVTSIANVKKPLQFCPEILVKGERMFISHTYIEFQNRLLNLRKVSNDTIRRILVGIESRRFSDILRTRNNLVLPSVALWMEDKNGNLRDLLSALCELSNLHDMQKKIDELHMDINTARQEYERLPRFRFLDKLKMVIINFTSSLILRIVK